jgi:peptide/nickel transport system permease protein
VVSVASAEQRSKETFLSSHRTAARFLRNPSGLASAILLLLVVVLCVGAPLFTHYGPNTPDLSALLAPPGAAHPFGTNPLGMDLFSQVLYAGRISLAIGALSAVIAGVIGALLGLVAGYFGGIVDTVIMRLVDTALSVPLLLIILVLVVMLGSSLYDVIGLIGLSGWMYPARIVRSQTLLEKELPYVEAARAIGCGGLTIMLRHIFPNIVGTLIVNVTIFVGQAVLMESAMSFLGAGLEPPNVSLGYLLNQSQSYLGSAPWLSIFPGLFIFLIVVGTNMFGDALRDALNPEITG